MPLSASQSRLGRGEAEDHTSASNVPLSKDVACDGARSATEDVPAVDSTKIWVTDKLLFSFQRCRRRAFLDTYGNPTDRDPPSDYLLKLRQDGLVHQRTVIDHRPTYEPRYSRFSWTEGAAATLELMQQGVEQITRGVLIGVDTTGTTLMSCPDLLVKQPGNSVFGDWLYAPMDIRLGKRPKLDYQISAAFHAYVLASVQGAWAETSWLVLRQRGAYAVDLVEMLPKMQETLEDCVEMVRSQQEPEVFIAHNRCDLCHWFSHCYAIANNEQHLSLLPGVTPSRFIHLKQLRLTNVEALAETNPKTLEPYPGFGSQVAHKLVQQAQASLQNQAMLRSPLENSLGVVITDEELPTAPIELYFDIEAAPEQNLVYLHGVLVVDRLNHATTFHPLLADQPDQEGSIWQNFLELVWRYPTAPIFHFCPYEVQTVKRLAQYYGTPYEQIEPLLPRFIDLHERVTRLVTLPVESYALKPIARWLGFNWQDSEANGAQSIYWYAQWLETGDRAYLEAILRYNEDDCRATHRVKDWLVEFVQSSSKSSRLS